MVRVVNYLMVRVIIVLTVKMDNALMLKVIHYLMVHWALIGGGRLKIMYLG